MPNGMIRPDEFEEWDDNTKKINTLYRLVYELYRKKRWDSPKIVFGGFLGAITFLFGKAIFWR